MALIIAMFSAENEIVWKIIGNDSFCSFKFISKNQKFCKNKYNITGFCSKQSCPLSNPKYATVLEKNGEIYLYIKDQFNSRYPDKLWKKFILSRNFLKSLQEVDFLLSVWPKFFVSKTKQKLTKLHQILIRKKLDVMKKKILIATRKNKPFLIKSQEAKLLSKIKFESLIESELLHRLNLGIYGNLYPINPIRIWKKNLSIVKYSKNIKKARVLSDKKIKLKQSI